VLTRAAARDASSHKRSSQQQPETVLTQSSSPDELTQSSSQQQPENKVLTQSSYVHKRSSQQSLKQSAHLVQQPVTSSHRAAVNSRLKTRQCSPERKQPVMRSHKRSQQQPETKCLHSEQPARPQSSSQHQADTVFHQSSSP
jgi:aspartate-semialdehyde dehydrogenase